MKRRFLDPHANPEWSCCPGGSEADGWRACEHEHSSSVATRRRSDAQGITTRRGSGDLVTRAASEIIIDPSARREAEEISASEIAGS